MPKRVRTTRRLEAWLKDTNLALFVLNAQRRLVFFNRGSERLTGWTAPDLLGQKCDYVSEADPQTPAALLAALAPPPEAWQGILQQAPVNLPRRAEPPLPRLIYYFPLADAESDVQAMLGVIVPVLDAPRSPSVPVSVRLHAELAALRQAIRERYGDGSLTGRSPSMRRVFEQLRLAQGNVSPVLLIGEAGSGKQHLARVLHSQSPRSKKAFVPLDCRGTSEDLGQVLARIREDRQADESSVGAVYLKSIDRAPADFQRDLIELLQDSPRNPVRVMAGSTHPLGPLVDDDRFSRDLYFGITALVIEIPPLRERMDDLEPLAQAFVEDQNRDAAVQVGGLSDDVWRQFRRYNWPGNVAELRQVIIEACTAAAGPIVKPEHLPFRFRTGVTAQSMEPAQRPRIEPLDQLLEQVEREQIERALAESRDNKARAAELLGINRARLYRRMEILGIVDPDPSTDSAT